MTDKENRESSWADAVTRLNKAVDQPASEHNQHEILAAWESVKNMLMGNSEIAVELLDQEKPVTDAQLRELLHRLREKAPKAAEAFKDILEETEEDTSQEDEPTN